MFRTRKDELIDNIYDILDKNKYKLKWKAIYFRKVVFQLANNNERNKYRSIISNYIKRVHKGREKINKLGLEYYINIHILMGGDIIRAATRNNLMCCCLYFAQRLNINDIDFTEFVSNKNVWNSSSTAKRKSLRRFLLLLQQL